MPSSNESENVDDSCRVPSGGAVISRRTGYKYFTVARYVQPGKSCAPGASKTIVRTAYSLEIAILDLLCAVLVHECDMT